MDGQTGMRRTTEDLLPSAGTEQTGIPREATSHEGSHSLELVHETLGRVEKYLDEEARKELSREESAPEEGGLRLARWLNHVLHHANVHIGHASEHERAARREYIATAKACALGTLQAAVTSPERFDAVYACLSDDASRSVFDWFIAYRTALAFLGKDADALVPGFITEEAWADILWRTSRTMSHGAFQLGGVALRSGLVEVATAFLLEQYRLQGFVEPEDGDTVLDCGAYRGETALWFARCVGRTGMVIAVEPSPQNAAGLRANLAANQSAGLAPVVVVEHAVGNRQGSISFNPAAEGSSRADSRSSFTVPVETIDSLVARLHLRRVDVVKMDIEGGEVDALDGATSTLQTFAPRLALSVYHRPADLPDIVERVRSAVPAYRLALSQKSPGFAETILFGRATEEGAR